MDAKEELEAKIINEYYNKNIKSRGEDMILTRLYSDKKLRKNINLLEDGIPLLSKISYFINNNFKNTKLLDIHNKLKKGIKDTLLINYPSLDKIKNISGPIEIAYYFNEKLQKRVIFIGEVHDGYKFSCNDNKTIPIENYIDQLFKTDIEIDLFLETDIPVNLKRYNSNKNADKDNYLFFGQFAEDNDIHNDKRINWDTSYLSEVTTLGIRNYKKNIKNRIHFVDNRNNPNAHEYLLHTIDKDKIKTFDEYKLFVKKNHDYIMSIYYFFKDKIIPKKEDIPEYLLKELIRADSENVEKIKPYILWLINTYIDNYNSNNIDLSMIQHDLNSKLSDLYVILRILKKDKINSKKDQFNNCILFNGIAHGSNIDQLLILLDFTFLNVFRSKSIQTCNTLNMTKENCDEFRCVKDIIPFDKFFTHMSAP